LLSSSRDQKRLKVKIVGIIGCGAIGTLIAQAVEQGIVPADRLILFDIDKPKAEALGRALSVSTMTVASLEEMMKLKPDVIVEAASVQAAKNYAGKIIAENVDLIVMSVGALLDMKLESDRIHIPSGAIGGLDAISSAALVGIEEIVLTTRKNPKALDLDVQADQVVYEGTARGAVQRFPREMNVAATLALTVGPEKLKVRVISDPRVHENVHEIRVKWKHGKMLLQFHNDPHPENPKTSALSAWSAIRQLNQVLRGRT
jgi:aspartate dehydrogenase